MANAHGKPKAGEGATVERYAPPSFTRAEEYVQCPGINDPEAFAARVVGDSMTPDYHEGDVVVFSPARELTNGCDCFVRLLPDHHTTFKRVFFEPGERVRLEPLNPAHPVKVVPLAEVSGLWPAIYRMSPRSAAIDAPAGPTVTVGLGVAVTWPGTDGPMEGTLIDGDADAGLTRRTDGVVERVAWSRLAVGCHQAGAPPLSPGVKVKGVHPDNEARAFTGYVLATDGDQITVLSPVGQSITVAARDLMITHIDGMSEVEEPLMLAGAVANG